MPERTITVTTKYYTFDQNNSGGRFHIDPVAGITKHVIIEATNAKDANHRAEDVGIYFNGCDSNRDCPCCGDRWWRTTEQDGTESPEIYGQPAEQYKAMNAQFLQHIVGQDDHKKKKELSPIVIHYLSGEIKWL